MNHFRKWHLVYLDIALVVMFILMLSACATTVTVEKPVFPAIPTELIAPPKEPTPLPQGNINPKDALTIIVQNNTILVQDEVQLKALIDWLNKTSQTINGPKRD